MPVEFNVSEFTTEEIIGLLALCPPHSPVQESLFAELQRRRGGPVLGSGVRYSPRLLEQWMKSVRNQLPSRVSGGAVNPTVLAREAR